MDGALDTAALQPITQWIDGFIAKPHPALGRDGPVCPFVPTALERKALQFAIERGAGDVDAAIRAIESHKAAFLRTPPIGGDDAIYKARVVVFPGLPASEAAQFFDAVLARIAASSYEQEGLVMGGFHPNNPGAAIHNRGFHPFRSPVPFLLMRKAVVGDWKFFLDDAEWLKRWSRRFGERATSALAEQMRTLPWRETQGATS